MIGGPRGLTWHHLPKVHDPPHDRDRQGSTRFISHYSLLRSFERQASPVSSAARPTAKQQGAKQPLDNQEDDLDAIPRSARWRAFPSYLYLSVTTRECLARPAAVHRIICPPLLSPCRLRAMQLCSSADRRATGMVRLNSGFFDPLAVMVSIAAVQTNRVLVYSTS